MRIAINAAFLGGRAEGTATYTRQVIGHLARSGHETLIYSSERPDVNGKGLARWRPTPASLRAEAGSLGNILRATVWSQTALPARVLCDRAEVLLSTLPEGMLLPACPQAVVVHDLFPLFFPELYPRWTHYYRRLLPRVLKASRRVIAVSYHTRHDLVNFLGVPEAKVTVVHNWIDPPGLGDETAAPPENFEPGPYFLYVGRLSPYKNLEMVIRAFAAVCSDVRERLVCVLGFFKPDRDAYSASVLRLAAGLGVRERLRIYSGISRTELLFLYRHATALVLLSKYEGFGFPPLEAMAEGTPAIVSDSTALAEVAGPGAVCVPNTEPGPAAEAMRRLALDAGYRALMAGRGKARARHFSRERSGRRILQALEYCAAGQDLCDEEHDDG